MNKKELHGLIKRACPNIPFLRKAISKRYIKRLHKLIPAEIVTQAEQDPSKKRQLAEEYRLKDAEAYKQCERSIDDLFHRAPAYLGLDESEKDKRRVDMLFCRFAYGFTPTEYLSYELNKKDESERRSFISEYDRQVYSAKMNDRSAKEVFRDKARTYELFKDYYHRDVVCIESGKDYSAFSDFVKKHPVFVAKEVYKACGRGIRRIDFSSCGKSERELFQELISNGKTSLEELVIQSPVTAAFNASSVNTIRLISFNTKHGVRIPYAFMKIGRAGSFVDNGGAGGILVGIDEKTGMTNTRGIDELHREYDVHPDSGTPFVGHQLPKWEQLLSMCRELSAKMPSVGYIGWDFAYTDKDEWIVIEGNGGSQYIGPQTIWQRGVKDEVQGYMSDMKLLA